MNALSRTALCALVLCLPACLEIEEEVDVAADGSVEVLVRASGDGPDLLAGHPLPTSAAWRGVDAASAAWLAGGPAPRRSQDPEGDDVEVAVRASFASVAELPTLFAPEDDPYRTARLERRTTLAIERKGARTVYVFERRLLNKAQVEWDANQRIMEELPEDLRQALDDGRSLAPHEWRQVVRTVQTAYADAFDAPIEPALLAIYLEGGAELSVAGLERVRQSLRAAVLARLDEGRLERLFEAWRAAEASESDQTELPLDVDLEKQARAAVRAALPAALESEGLAPGLVNAVLERVEWAFTAVDDANDRADETLRLKLRLPGRLVGGNYGQVDAAGRAVWEIKDEAWRSGELVLRAVSVLE